MEKKLTMWEIATGTPRAIYRVGGFAINSIKKSFKSNPISSSIQAAFPIVVLTAGLYGVIRNGRQEAYGASLLQSVSDLADRKFGDANGHTLDNEWSNLYDSLGMKYDSQLSDPERDLSIEQRESLLEEISLRWK